MDTIKVCWSLHEGIVASRPRNYNYAIKTYCTLQQCWTTSVNHALPIAWGNSVAKSEFKTRGVV